MDEQPVQLLRHRRQVTLARPVSWTIRNESVMNTNAMALPACFCRLLSLFYFAIVLGYKKNSTTA